MSKLLDASGTPVANTNEPETIPVAVFYPAADITAIELALIAAPQMMAYNPAFVASLPEQLRRHFRLVDKPVEQQQ